MNDRRRKQKKKRRAHALAWLIFIGLAVCVVLSLTVLFPVVSVTVTGDVTSYSQQDILDAAGIETGKNLFSFSAARVKSRICESLPYIENASVHRKMSGEVTIECTESTDFLAIPCGDCCLIINTALKIVARENPDEKGRTEVFGLSPKTPVVGAVLQVSDAEGTEYLQYVIDAIMAEELLPHIVSINVADKLNIALSYEDRLYVMVGTANNIGDKMKMLAHVTSSKLSETETGYIDLSESGKATLKSGAFALPEDYAVPAVISTE
ncbi:MAG: FtsQ-type POTRA domain-containing protein [Oscillospiraceae bacterium]|nr:FtsQ-type POTRA domain-containing protein [Oscillospiraceae bacterium]